MSAYLDTSISTLGFEIAGNSAKRAGMTLSISEGVYLEGRNEIRLSPHSEIQLNGGTLKSIRWVDIFNNATLNGSGRVDSTLYNKGNLDITKGDRGKAGKIVISGDYHQDESGNLTVDLGHDTPLVVGGIANLDGLVGLEIPKGTSLKKGRRMTLVKAASIVGNFSNANGIVKSGDQKFRIHYGATMVELEKLN